MKTFTLLTALLIGSAVAKPQFPDPEKLDYVHDSLEAGKEEKRQDDSGLTLGTLITALEKISDSIGEKVPELEEPAKDLSKALSAFEEAAKTVDIPSATSSAA